MTFLAGAVALEAQSLVEGERTRFLEALAGIEPLLPRRPALLSRPSRLLAQAGHGRLWQGPLLLSTPHLDAGAAGVQWRRLEGEETALGALARELLGTDPAPPEAFDGYSCALLPRKGGDPTLAVDPVGLFPLCYTLRRGTLFFSTLQTFLCVLLGSEARPDLQAALEFLVAGHPLGDKTLMEGVRMLPPGTRLVCRDGGVHVSSYARRLSPDRDPVARISASAAADRLYEHLVHKRDRYARLANDPVIGFLSGGWDSRLLVALFAEAGRISHTLTTRQKVRFHGRYVSEERIAREVARLLDVENRFVPPLYRDPSTLHRRAARLDHATWFHDWSFAMAEEVPEGRFLMLDGLLGDILLRALFLDDELAAAQEAGDRGALCRILHRRFVRGFNPYTPGLDAWSAVLRPEILQSFSDRLQEWLEDEVGGIGHPEAATLFFLRNRSRRAIAPLPRLVFGRKGDVHLPFCDPGFVRTALSLPLEGRRDGSVYRRLLERAHPGLAAIPSTNEKDPGRMAPFLTETLPRDTLEGRSERRKARLRALCHRPPRVFASILRPEILEALEGGDPDLLKPHLLLLEKVLMLEGFFGEWWRESD